MSQGKAERSEAAAKKKSWRRRPVPEDGAEGAATTTGFSILILGIIASAFGFGFVIYWIKRLPQGWKDNQQINVIPDPIDDR